MRRLPQLIGLALAAVLATPGLMSASAGGGGHGGDSQATDGASGEYTPYVASALEVQYGVCVQCHGDALLTVKQPSALGAEAAPSARPMVGGSDTWPS